MSGLEIAIQYPPGGDGEDTALAYARRLFAVLNESIDALLLVPTAGADITVIVNGRCVYAEQQAGRPPRLADVLNALPPPEDEHDTAPKPPEG